MCGHGPTIVALDHEPIEREVLAAYGKRLVGCDETAELPHRLDRLAVAISVRVGHRDPASTLFPHVIFLRSTQFGRSRRRTGPALVHVTTDVALM